MGVRRMSGPAKLPSEFHPNVTSEQWYVRLRLTFCVLPRSLAPIQRDTGSKIWGLEFRSSA